MCACVTGCDFRGTLSLILVQYVAIAPLILFSGLSVLLVEIIQQFNVDRALALNIQTMYSSTTALSLLLGGAIVPKLGCGVVIFLSVSCFFVGLIAASFSNSTVLLILTASVLPAVGAGMMFNTTNTFCAKFAKRKRVWLSLVQMSSATGTVIGPLLMNSLIRVYGWRGSCVLSAGVVLQAVPIGLFIYCIERESRQSEAPPKNIYKNILKGMTQKRLLIILSTVSTLKFIGLFPVSIIVDLVYTKGYSQSEGSICLSLEGIGAIAGNIFSVILAWFLTRRYLVVCGVAALFFIAPMLMFTLVGEYSELIGTSMLTGFMRGTIFPAISIVMAHEAHPEVFPVAMGATGIFEGIAGISSGPFAGWVRDKTGQYDAYLYLIAASCVPLAAVLFIAEAVGRPAIVMEEKIVEVESKLLSNGVTGHSIPGLSDGVADHCEVETKLLSNGVADYCETKLHSDGVTDHSNVESTLLSNGGTDRSIPV